MSPIHDVLKARRIEICNSNGMCAISLDCWSDGHPFIRLYDMQGREKLVLSLNQHNQPQIGLLDSEGATIVGIGVTDELGCGLNLFDTTGALKVMIAVKPDGTSVVKAVD